MEALFFLVVVLAIGAVVYYKGDAIRKLFKKKVQPQLDELKDKFDD